MVFPASLSQSSVQPLRFAIRATTSDSQTGHGRSILAMSTASVEAKVACQRERRAAHSDIQPGAGDNSRFSNPSKAASS
jgi:hypothetical protein